MVLELRGTENAPILRGRSGSVKERQQSRPVNNCEQEETPMRDARLGQLRLGHVRLGLAALVCALTPTPSAWAQTSPASPAFPTKPIKLIVPFPAGGPADTIGRVFAEKLSATLGQPVVIENRGGAGGVTGIALVAKADPDGHTIGIASAGALAMSVSMQEKMPYDPLKDLVLLTQAASVAELLVVGPQVEAKTLQELVALAKAQPGKLNFASTGLGSMPHLAAELFKVTSKIDIVHVPYAGAAPAVNDVLGGHVQMLFADVPILLGSVQSGKLRALAVGSKNRITALPDVPTTAEGGLPKVEADNWYGIVTPVKLPPAILATLRTASTESLKSPEVKDRLAKQGVVTVGNSTEEFTAYVKGEIERWSDVVREAGIKAK
jgi:tripartite-type tricarboxylate transporter receptor subunit TctC